MKRIAAIFLALSLLMLCGCDINIGGGENKQNETIGNQLQFGENLFEVQKYTAQQQEIFSKDGVSVSVIAGEYSSVPQFQVKNTSKQDVAVVLDAVVYNDVFQAAAMTGAGNVYRVSAGTDEMLSKCPLLHGTNVSAMGAGQMTIVGGNIASGSAIQYGTAGQVQKREVRFAVYKLGGNVDEKELPKEENLLYRSDLVLLKTSDYDGKAVTKNLPGGECLYEKDGIRVWWQSAVFATSINGTGGNIVGSFENTFEGAFDFSENATKGDGNTVITVKPSGTVTYYAYSTFGGGTCVDNATGKDIRVEFVATRTAKDDKNDKGEITITQELFMTVPAGKASMQLQDESGRQTAAVGAEKLDLRIYDAASGELIAEAKGLDVKANIPTGSIGSDGTSLPGQIITVQPSK